MSAGVALWGQAQARRLPCATQQLAPAAPVARWGLRRRTTIRCGHLTRVCLAFLPLSSSSRFTLLQHIRVSAGPGAGPQYHLLTNRLAVAACGGAVAAAATHDRLAVFFAEASPSSAAILSPDFVAYAGRADSGPPACDLPLVPTQPSPLHLPGYCDDGELFGEGGAAEGGGSAAGGRRHRGLSPVYAPTLPEVAELRGGDKRDAATSVAATDASASVGAAADEGEGEWGEIRGLCFVELPTAAAPSSHRRGAAVCHHLAVLIHPAFDMCYTEVRTKAEARRGEGHRLLRPVVCAHLLACAAGLLGKRRACILCTAFPRLAAATTSWPCLILPRSPYLSAPGRLPRLAPTRASPACVASRRLLDPVAGPAAPLHARRHRSRPARSRCVRCA